MGEDRTVHAEVGVLGMEGFHPIDLETPAGVVRARWYEAESELAVAYVGGAGDAWDTPADSLYPRLCEELTAEGVQGLRVRFHSVRDFDACVRDLLAGVDFLLNETGVRRIGLVGHSLGGAVAIAAGARTPETRTVVALATQSYGAEPERLPAGCSLLLIHGDADAVLSPSVSRHVYTQAHEPKAIVVIPAAGHVLDEAAPRVREEVRAWLVRELRR